MDKIHIFGIPMIDKYFGEYTKLNESSSQLSTHLFIALLVPDSGQSNTQCRGALHPRRANIPSRPVGKWFPLLAV